MFKLHLFNHLTSRTALMLLVVLSLVFALLPTVALAAPPVAPVNGQHDGRGPLPNGPCTNYYRVQRGETLSGIATRWGVSVWALREANGIGDPNRIYAGQRLCIPHAGWPGGPGPGMPGHDGHLYTVQRGDTLSAIALHFHTSVWWLMQVNHLRNPNHIYSGQVLRVG